jgi:hypothetical protein
MPAATETLGRRTACPFMSIRVGFDGLRADADDALLALYRQHQWGVEGLDYFRLDCTTRVVEVVERHSQLDAANLMEAVHNALRPTRGAAAAVAMLQAESELCTFCGVGNISASICGPGNARSMVSHNGILGHQVRKMQEFSYPFPRGALCIAHSDGLGTHWDLANYPGLSARHPALVAAALNRDHSRGSDDVTVVALRNGASAAA